MPVPDMIESVQHLASNLFDSPQASKNKFNETTTYLPLYLAILFWYRSGYFDDLIRLRSKLLNTYTD